MIVTENQKKIVFILSDGQFHSGTELAKALNISRSAICKQLKSLTELGLIFSAISGKGYCLDRPLQLLDQAEIERQLQPKTLELISELEIHYCIDSTNRHLLEKSQQSPSTGVVCFAEYQTAGKGRRGRSWVSPFGSNIYLSVLWQFQQGPAAISGLSLAIGVAVIRALNECGITDVGLKWPNDIYWRDKKLAGILIEVSGESNGPCNAVVGLGLNFYVPQQMATSIEQDWVDLSQILSDNPARLRNKMAAVLLNQMISVMADFEQQSLDAYLDEWRSYDCMLDKKVQIFFARQTVNGTVKGINDNGLLLLANEQGEIKPYASGEVSFRR